VADRDEFVAHARGRKAFLLAWTLIQNGASDPRTVDRLGGHFRREAEAQARVRAASPETWAAVIGIIEAMTEVGALPAEVAS
jgi:hypothetical protein